MQSKREHRTRNKARRVRVHNRMFVVGILGAKHKGHAELSCEHHCSYVSSNGWHVRASQQNFKYTTSRATVGGWVHLPLASLSLIIVHRDLKLVEESEGKGNVVSTFPGG